MESAVDGPQEEVPSEQNPQSVSHISMVPALQEDGIAPVSGMCRSFIEMNKSRNEEKNKGEFWLPLTLTSCLGSVICTLLTRNTASASCAVCTLTKAHW